MKKILVLILAIIMVLSLATPALATDSNATRSNKVKEASHSFAEVLRYFGFKDDSLAIRVTKLVWAWADGKDVGGSYLYDATTDTRYYFGEPTTADVDGDYSDGTYYWFWNSSAQRYYRYDRNGNIVWGGGSRSSGGTSGGGNTVLSNIDTSYAYTANSSNIYNYDYSYKGVKLYAGRIYGLKGFDANEVETLAKLIKSYTDGHNVLYKNAFVWSVNSLKDGNTWDYVIDRYYKYYDSSITLTEDDREFAREMLFRIALKKAGYSFYGQTLPDGYNWVHDDGNWHLYFRQTENGPNYEFPYAYATSGSTMRSPY